MREEERLSEDCRGEPQCSPSEREAELALSALRPARPGFDVGQLTFEAARRASGKEVWAWRGIAAALAAGLVLSMLLRPSPRVVEKPVYVQVPSHESPQPTHSPVATATLPEPEFVLRGGNDYLALRDRVLALGIRSLPQPQPPAGSVVPALSAPKARDMPPSDAIHQLFDAMQFGGRS